MTVLTPLQALRQSWLIHPDWTPEVHRSFLINDADWAYTWDDRDIPCVHDIERLLVGWKMERPKPKESPTRG